uniref:General transcription factor 3C polypeptide 5 n=1 Tax=Caenorhabditis japonica TaxID=281687 RepID=A0A8R1DJE5_CAEJA
MNDFLRFPAQKKDEPKQLILIRYPGIIKNIDKALQSLGGLQQVSSAHFNNNSIELSHTPENPYTSRIVAEKKNQEAISSGTLNLVMKIKRKKNDPGKVKTKILGLVDTIYTFDVMCDFQYLPLKKRVGSDTFDDLIPKLIPTDLSTALGWWTQDKAQNTPLFLPPYQFSRYLTPSSKILGKETDHGEKTKQSMRSGYGQNMRVERKALSVSVHAKSEFPLAPSNEAVEDAMFRCKHEEPHRLLRELFEERPMWTRVGILYRTRLDDSLLRCIIQKYAFYIQSGPWGRLWCKFGYDPRIDKEGGLYQTLMVSFRQHGSIPERQRLKVSSDRSQQGTLYATGDDVNYLYEQGKLPRVRQMWYCVTDVRLPQAIEELISVVESNYRPNPEDVRDRGWLPPPVLEKIRDLIKEDVAKTSNELEAQMHEQEEDEFDYHLFYRQISLIEQKPHSYLLVA